MIEKGIVFRGEIDKFKLNGIDTKQSQSFDIPFTKTLFVEPGTKIPIDLLPAAWNFLDRWDIAVPLWRYGQTAADIGTDKDKRATQAVVRDLRVLLHSYELLFVRNNDTCKAFMEQWAQECQNGDDKRLAFLRALYIVKPRCCVLPTSWLAEVKNRETKYANRYPMPKSPNAGKPLVAVEVQPGRYVKCHKGDEEKVLAQFANMQRGRVR